MKFSLRWPLFLMAMAMPSAIFCQTTASSREESSAQRIALATREVERIKPLVESGVEAPIRLAQAEQDLADAQDRALLDRVQYADSVHADAQGDDMIAAAERRVSREKERIEQQKKLIADGLVASRDLTSLEEELSQRQLDLYWAQSRLQFRLQSDELAKRRDAIALAQEAARVEYEDFSVDGMEHYDGTGSFDEERDLKMLAAAYETEFAHALPISADGETELHRSLGFDHRGKIDVAVDPNESAGIWLRRYLRARQIPYFAFSRAIPGKATAAHIHIGTSSTRLSGAGSARLGNSGRTHSVTAD
jgi:hypothetical protein